MSLNEFLKKGRGGERNYLAVDHGGPHAGRVVLYLVGCGDEVYVCLYHDGRVCLSFLLALT